MATPLPHHHRGEAPPRPYPVPMEEIQSLQTTPRNTSRLLFSSVNVPLLTFLFLVVVLSPIYTIYTAANVVALLWREVDDISLWALIACDDWTHC